MAITGAGGAVNATSNQYCLPGGGPAFHIRARSRFAGIATSMSSWRSCRTPSNVFAARQRRQGLPRSDMPWADGVFERAVDHRGPDRRRLFRTALPYLLHAGAGGFCRIRRAGLRRIIDRVSRSMRLRRLLAACSSAFFLSACLPYCPRKWHMAATGSLMAAAALLGVINARRASGSWSSLLITILTLNCSCRSSMLDAETTAFPTQSPSAGVTVDRLQRPQTNFASE